MNPQNGTALPRRPASPEREDVIVTRLERLGTVLDGEPDPEFCAATRARLVAMAAVRTPAPAPTPRLRRLLSARAEDAAPLRWRSRLTAGLAGAAMTVTAVAALAAVASGARPGDLLYGLKRGTEQTQLALASDSTRGQTYLDLASTRLGELRSLVEGGTSAQPVAGAAGGAGLDVVAAGAPTDLVLQTIHTMDAQTTDGAAWLDGRSVRARDTAPLDRLTSWAAGQKAGLAALQPEMPAAAEHALQDSLDLLATISTRAGALETSLGCASGPAVSGTDTLGPVPAPCVVPPATAGGSTGSTSIPPNVAATTPAVPTPGSGRSSAGGTGGTAPGGTTSGGPGLPTGGITGIVPTPPGGGSTTTVVPTTPPTLTVPQLTVPKLTVPKVTVPKVTVPGLAGPTTTSSTTTAPSSSGLHICLGPIGLGC